MSKDNLTLLTGMPDKQRAQLEELKRSIPVLMEFFEVDAQIKRGKYLAFIGKGFNEAQALELCK
ncbi:hypothetical protein ACCD10_17865 [Pseudomonas sp. Pseusp122]|uniref:hypothetical protein n=1 Tax=unclassified Pseudomonas TaxID=196821 RepID=UPI0039A45BAF